jgi:hypothetical protein
VLTLQPDPSQAQDDGLAPSRERLSFMLVRLTLLVVMSGAQLACAQLPATRPVVAGPVSYAEEVRQKPAMHLHVVTINLTDPAVSVVVRPAGADPDGAGPWATTLMTVRAIAERDDLAVAVNGDFFASKDVHEVFGRKVAYFAGNWARPCCNARSDGANWADPLNVGRPTLNVSPGNRISIAAGPAAIPKEAREVVGGSLVLVENGRAVGRSAEAAAPRTAAGVDKEGKRLILLVVDGRRPDYSAGMTIEELAAEMVRLGCDRAINLDGGGSSTMVVRDPKTGLAGVMNRPSDGHDFVIPFSLERPVANVLGVRVGKGGEAKPAR